jgi:hypothetical protein
MPRRGQCRCGLILTFRRTAQGYKMRCPSCGAVVRLRTGKKRRRPTANEAGLAPPAPGEIDVELVPVPAAAPTSPPRGRWLVAVVAAVALLGVVAGAVWWFSR